jgi:hypothetical protein
MASSSIPITATTTATNNTNTTNTFLPLTAHHSHITITIISLQPYQNHTNPLNLSTHSFCHHSSRPTRRSSSRNPRRHQRANRQRVVVRVVDELVLVA